MAAAPAPASIAFERGEEIWVADDDGNGARRLAEGREPHVAPGGATVVYRSRGGRRVYAPAAGGPRRTLLTLPPIRRNRAFIELGVDFATGGGHALVSQLTGRAILVDLTTGAARRIDVPVDRGRLSPDGASVLVPDRRRPCELDVLDLATGRYRTLAGNLCVTDLEWGPGGIAVVSTGAHRTRVIAIDPATGARRTLLSLPRELGLREPGVSGAWRVEVYERPANAPAARLLLPDGGQLSRTFPGGNAVPVTFAPDDRSAYFQRDSGAVYRVDLATGERRRVASVRGDFSAG